MEEKQSCNQALGKEDNELIDSCHLCASTTVAAA